MPYERRDWDVRTNRKPLTESEKEFIRRSGRDGEKVSHVAKSLKCSIRPVLKYYSMFGFSKSSAERRPRILQRRAHYTPRERLDDKEQKPIPRPDRFYHSNF